jgi:hypothetical protein
VRLVVSSAPVQSLPPLSGKDMASPCEREKFPSKPRQNNTDDCANWE